MISVVNCSLDFFFFQAEDGLRDGTVTGLQTCALPILRRVVDEFEGRRVLIGELYLPFERQLRYYGRDLAGAHLPFNFALLQTPWHAASLAKLIAEIGRASCR